MAPKTTETSTEIRDPAPEKIVRPMGTAVVPRTKSWPHFSRQLVQQFGTKLH
jgi:hypothetical protein